jgi:hypothetical protein
MQSLFYLYGIVPADAAPPPDAVSGIDGQPVRLVPAGGVSALVSEVDPRVYAEETLNERLGDLAWVGERGMAHERVLDWFLERGPVIPSSLFSLHAGEARLRERFEPESERMSTLLQRLAGRREWGIKLWRQEEALREHIDELSPTLRAMRAEVETAAPGRRFLLEKKMDTVRTEELRTVSRRVAHQSYSLLQAGAERAATIPIPAAAGESGRTLLLHAAFLVEDATFGEFQACVTRVAHEFGGVGFDVEFTGPWPPYHFVGADD